MLQHYIKTAWRNLTKNKSLSFINITGLAISMAVCLAILLYINHETSYDSFHEKKEQIFRVEVERYQDNVLTEKDAYTTPALGPVLKAEMPEVQNFFRLVDWADNFTLTSATPEYGNLSFKEDNAGFADQAFLQYFDFQFLAGNKTSALSAPNSFIISSSLARKIFGKQSTSAPIGKIFSVYTSNGDNKIEAMLQGVYQDIPNKSHLQYDLLFSHSTLPSFLPREIPEEQRLSMFENAWGPNAWYTYLIIDENQDHEKVADKISNHIMQRNNLEAINKLEYKLQPIERIHLYSDVKNEPTPKGDLQQLYLLGAVAMMLLLIATINFVNLNIAHTLNRIQEFFTRITNGANRWEIIKQLIVQNLLMVLAGALFCIIIVWLLNQFTVDLIYWQDLVSFNRFSWVGIGLFTLIVISITASILLFVNMYNRIEKQKRLGKNRVGGALQKSLVTLQLVISLALIAGSFSMYRQINFMTSQNPGFDTEQMVLVDNPNITNGQFQQMVNTLHQRLSSYPFVKEVSAVNTPPGYLSGNYVQMSLANTSETSKTIKDIRLDSRFLQSLEVNLLAGNLLSEDAEEKSQIILNEKATRQLSIESPDDAIGQAVAIQNAYGKEMFTITGVIENFHHQSLKEDFQPMAFFPGISNGFVSIKLSSEHSLSWPEIQSELAEEWAIVFPGNPFNYQFLDDLYYRQYRQEENLARAMNIFAIIAMVIAGMGMLGITINTLRKKVKEVSIRKVMGASVGQLYFLLIKSQLSLVVVASVLYIPLAYYGIGRWLSSFAYRVEVSPLQFVVPVIILISALLALISIHIIRTSRVNPAKTLRDD